MKSKLFLIMLAALALVVAGQARADLGGPDDFGYTYADSAETTVTYEWVDISGMSPTTLTLDDDGESPAIAIGFPFTFYGTAYNTIYVHANGFVKFDAEVYEYYMGDQCPLPSPDDVDGMIAFFLRDFNPAESASGDVRWASDTTSTPNRFIVEFDNVPICCSPYPTGVTPDPATVQLVLYDTGEIQVNVANPGPATGGDTTIGLEAPDAISGLSYRGCLISTSVEADTAIRFTPPAGGTPIMPTTSKKWGRPGNTLSYEFYIFNLETATINFTIAESTSSWSPTLSATSLSLDPGGSSTFTLDVTIPGTAADGASDVSTVTFTPDSGDPATVYAIALVQDEATEVNWQQLDDMPMELENPAAAVVDDYIFVLGGIRLDEISETPIYETSVHRYNVATNVWDSVADMPEGRSNLAACGMDGTVYAMGGYGETSGEAQMAWDLFIYDVASDTWETGGVMPSGRVQHGAVCDASGGRVYVMGGIINTTDTTLENAELANDMVVYNATAGSWSAGTAMTYYRYDFVAGMTDADTIVVAGNAYDMPGGKRTEAYSISGGAWTPLDELTVVRGTAAGGTLEGGTFCIAGGFNLVGAYGRDDTFECYNAPYWIPQIPLLNVARNNMAYATHNGQIYAIAGDWVDESGTEPVLALSATIERYPHSPVPDGATDVVEDDVVEDVPTDPTDVTDVPVDTPTDTTTDTTTDTPTDGTTDVEEEGDGGDDGCGCHMVY